MATATYKTQMPGGPPLWVHNCDSEKSAIAKYRDKFRPARIGRDNEDIKAEVDTSNRTPNVHSTGVCLFDAWIGKVPKEIQEEMKHQKETHDRLRGVGTKEEKQPVAAGDK